MAPSLLDAGSASRNSADGATLRLVPDSNALVGLVAFGYTMTGIDRSAVRVLRPRLDYEPNATSLDRNELGLFLVQTSPPVAKTTPWRVCWR